MDLGLCTISNRDLAVEDILERAADAGYDGVEVWGRDHVGDGSERTCRRVREAAADRDLSILTYGSYLRAGADTFADELAHEVAVADRLNADRIRTWAGTTEYGDHDASQWDETVADLRELTAAATERGIDVTVEKHPGYLTNDAEGARRVIEAVAKPGCRLNYQPMFSLSAAEISSEIERLAPLSNQLHLQAVPDVGGSADDRCLLSAAFYDLEHLVAQFREFGADDGSIHVEFVTDDLPYQEATAKDCAFLRSLLN